MFPNTFVNYYNQETTNINHFRSLHNKAIHFNVVITSHVKNLKNSKRKQKRKPCTGLEPVTFRLKVWRSTDWANEAFDVFFEIKINIYLLLNYFFSIFRTIWATNHSNSSANIIFTIFIYIYISWNVLKSWNGIKISIDQIKMSIVRCRFYQIISNKH